MARRALLIGAQTGVLSGVGNDVASMSAALDSWGFRSVRCEAENASRAGILDAYERLIADTRAGDAVVVYYSGHGGYARPPAELSVAPHRSALQFIVPTDYRESTEDDFRGITSVELSLLLARLTEETRNVTVVLDCCHAAHMSRDWDLAPKALSRAVSYRVVAAHLDNLRRRGQEVERWHPPGNPDAVRIVACAPEQSAYEYHNHDGLRTGMLTDALTQALAEARAADLAISWATVIDRVRHRVLAVMPGQRPDAEGPAHRLLFDVSEADPLTSLPATMVAGRVRISGAALLGVRPGDEFVVLPAEPREGKEIGEVRVDRVDAEAAWGELRPVGQAAVSLGARAHLVRTAAPVLSVRVAEPPADLVRAMADAPLLRLAESDEDSPVRVVCRDGLTVHDERGPLHAPRPVDGTGVRRVVQDLTRLARARALRRLAEDTGDTLSTPLSVEFGQVEHGRVRPLAPAGAVVHVGQSICVRVRNDGAARSYVSLLDIGVAARITVLNPSSPSGVRLEPGAEYVFGGNDVTGAVPGVSLSWPDDLPGDGPRPETIVVLATSAPVDTRVLEQQGVRGVDARPRSNLQRRLDQLSTGGPRDLAPALGPAMRFAVRTIDFELVPTTAPAEHVPFQVDDRPAPTARLWQPRSSAATRVAVRLADLVVHHNRAFRSTDIRLDTVVVAGRWHARTERFVGVSDGQRLPVEDLVLYQGEVTDSVDVAVWVSRDGGPSLADLLPDPPADPAAVVDMAHRLLTRLDGDCVGLYRTTLLAHEQFGVGSHTVRAQDFSFRCSVVPVAAAFGPSGEGWKVPALDS